MALAVGAEKKIELQDIEEDNLRSEMRSEKDKELDKSDSPQSSGPGTGPGFNSLDFFKSAGLLRYFENSQPAPQAPPQQQRYVHQYAVTEQPERAAPAAINNRVQYAPSGAQQAMVGYLSNMPMQIYLVPQYYSDQSDQSNQPLATQQYQSPGVARVAAYQTAPEAVQTQTNFIELPAYVAPSGKSYVQHHGPPQSVTYVTYPTQPTPATPQPTAAPVVYQVPVIQYNPALVAPTSASKAYYQNSEYTDTNVVDEIITDQNEQKQYSTHTQTEDPYNYPTSADFPRHYNSRTPIREELRHHGIPELPRPNPLLLKGSPSQISHIPKALPLYRPLSKPVYQGGGFSSFTPRPHEHYGPPSFKRRPTSLLDSYIPSSLQLEYLKRGLVKEPFDAYDALANGRLPHPRHLERGFLPNQMYHTGAGGVTYGHFKRNPKVSHK